MMPKLSIHMDIDLIYKWCSQISTNKKLESHPAVKRQWLQVSQLHTVQKHISALRRCAGCLPAGLHHLRLVKMICSNRSFNRSLNGQDRDLNSGLGSLKVVILLS